VISAIYANLLRIVDLNVFFWSVISQTRWGLNEAYRLSWLILFVARSLNAASHDEALIREGRQGKIWLKIGLVYFTVPVPPATSTNLYMLSGQIFVPRAE